MKRTLHIVAVDEDSFECSWAGLTYASVAITFVMGLVLIVTARRTAYRISTEAGAGGPGPHLGIDHRRAVYRS